MAGIASLDIDDEQVLAHGLVKAFTVALVAHAGNDLDPRCFALLVGLALLAGDGLDVDSRRECDLLAVGRPDGWAGASLQRGELARLAALQRQDEELRTLGITVGHEGEHATVGRPARGRVAVASACQR